MTRLLLALAGLLLTALVEPVTARELGTGPLPVQIDDAGQLAFAAGDELQIEGMVEANGPVVVVLRVDDQQSTSYASRFNAERTLPAGPFHWKFAASGLRSSDGRTLDYLHLRQMVLFVGAGTGRVTLKRFEVASAPKLPEGVKGYALGAKRSELPAGFERISPGDPRVAGANIFPVHRPAPDPLVASGLRGIERLRLPSPGGRVSVTIWTEDPGEWELLPHPLERRIRINGQDVISQRMTSNEWLQRRYLRAIDVEHGPTDDAWTAYGRLRGDARTVEVESGPSGIEIELAGSSAEALYLSAVLVEPAGSTAGRDFVESMRSEWYRSNWPVVAPAAIRGPSTTFKIGADGSLDSAVTLRATAAPGTGAHLIANVISGTTIESPAIRLQPPARNRVELSGLVWAGQKRLERRSAGDTVLTLGDNMLSGTPGKLPLKASEPRTYEIWIDVPASTPPGTYNGALLIGDGSQNATLPLEIEVVAIKLPPPGKPAGFYVDEAPHLTWFDAPASSRDNQATCDLAFLSRLGLNGSAPPLATASGAFLADMKRAAETGIVPNWLAYAPAKRLLEQHGIDGSAAIIASIERELRQAGLPSPVWSLADEPSNPGLGPHHLQDWIAAIRNQSPGVRIAAQLNSPADRPLIEAFDTVLLNNGYGLDPAALADAKARGAEVWLYNSGHPRVTAGIWLWITSASRYVQWHGRMPTADPFDPTDGREGDVQAFLPGRTVCLDVPSIDRSMLEMADGIVDQRWLSWLSDATTTSATLLRQKLKGQLPSSWAAAADLDASGLQGIREAIVEVARQEQ